MFALVYNVKQAVTLFRAKVIKQFLEDENGKVYKMLITCQKAKVGLGTVLEDTPKDLPLDQGVFHPWDLTYGPFDIIPHRSNKFQVACYGDATYG